MSVVAISPRTHPPAGPARSAQPRRRTAPTAAAPVLTITFDLALGDAAPTPEASRVLDLLRELVERGEGSVTVTDPAAAPPAGEQPATVRPLAVAGTAEQVAAGQPVRLVGPDGSVEPVGRDESDATAGQIAPVRAESAGQLRILAASRVVLRDGEPIPLTRLEFDLLLFFAEHPRRVFTRVQLLSRVWGYEHGLARTVDVHVRRLRAKVGTATSLLTTVYGVGYRLADEAHVTIDYRY